MPTKNPRVNITFEAQWLAVLSEMAASEGKSVSGLAKELVLEALDRREDMALSAIAKKRDTKGSKFVSHKDAWR